MRLVEHMRAHPWRAAALAGALCGAIIGLFLPIRAATPPKSDDAGWRLPNTDAIKRFDAAQYQAVRSAGFWGDIKTPGQRGDQASTWTLNAIVTRPDTRIAVTTAGGAGGRKPELVWIPLGGKLPDGGLFVAATRDTAWYERDGCRRARHLYEKPSADADACIGAKKPQPATSDASGSAAPASTPLRKLL